MTTSAAPVDRPAPDPEAAGTDESRRRRQFPPRLCRFLPYLSWLLAAAWALVALARLLGWHLDRWPVVMEPAVAPYAALTAVIPIGVAMVARRWFAAVLAAAALVALAGAVAPRAFGSPDPARGPMVRAMTANLREGHAGPSSLVDLVRGQRVDVLAIEEVTPAELDRLTAAGLSGVLPYWTANPQWVGPAGTALFSRYPISAAGRHDLPNDFTETSATVRVPGAAPVFVDVIHYCAPVDIGQTECWNAGVRSIPPASPRGPVRLLMGDFNMTLDFPDLRNVIATGYRDAADTVGAGLTPTWPYLGPPLPRLTIDHVLADRRIGISSVSVHPVDNSDHRAVLAELTFPSRG